MPLISAKHPSTPHQSHSHSHPHSNAQQTGSAPSTTPVPPIPSIRLISATPSSSGLSSSADGSRSMSLTLEESWAASLASLPVPPSALGSSNSGFTSNVSLLAPKDKEGANGKGQQDGGKKKLVPKKSKLSILGLGSSSAGKDKYSGRDFSDVVRRVGAAEQLPSGLSSASMNLKGGFEIYVDPTDDPDIGEIVMIKKKKSRAGLDGVRWGAGGGSPMQEANPNLPLPKDNGVGKEGVLKKESKDVLLKPPSLNGEKETGKENAKGGWWATIGRGRKDSKEEKDKKKDKENKISHKPVEYIHEPHPRSKTPDPFKPSSISKGTSKDTTSRGRFNSLGSTFLLGGSSQSRAPTPVQETSNANMNSVRGLQAYTKQAKSSLPPLSQFSSYGQPSIVPMPMDDDEDDVPRPALARSSTAPLPQVAMDVDRDMNRERTYSRSTTPTFGGFLAPPNMSGVPAHGQGQTQGSAPGQGQTQNGQGSIALRAIRSVRSLARMGSWAQLKNMPAPSTDDADALAGEDNKGTVKEKKSKKSKSSSKDKENANAADAGEEKTKKKKSVKKEKDGKEKEKTDKKTKKEKKTKEEKEKLKPKAATLRMSSSSFEIGALTASPGPAPSNAPGAPGAPGGGYASSTYDASPMQSRTLGPSSGLGATLQVGAGISNQSQPAAVGKKQSTLFGGLGLGLPSSMRLQSVRMGSSASSKYEVPSGQSASLGGGLMPAAVITEKVKENSKEKGDARTPMGSLRKPTDPSEVIANIINSNRLSVESARLAQLGTHPSSSSVNLVPGANAKGNQNRASSIISSGSSLRPISTSSMGSGMDRRLSSASGCSRLSAISAGGASALSGVSGVSAGSAATGASGGSVRWDEEGLESARAARRKERAEREKGMSRQERQERRASKESRRSAEGRRRTPIMSVFPELDPSNGGAEGEKMDVDDVEMRDADAYGGMEEEDNEEEEDVDERRQRRRGFEYPILTIEEATSDGHGAICDSDDDDAGDAEDVVARGRKGGEGAKEAKEERKTQAETPVKKARARPLSEQMLGKSRPRAMHEDDHDEGVLSILDAATNDLAQLINNLDLQATPCSTPGQTPLRPSPFGTPNVGASPTPVSTLEKPGPGASLSKANVKKARGGVADSPLGLKSAKKAGVSAWVLAQSQGRAQGAMLKREESTTSISSLRPYAQSRAAHTATVTTKSLMGGGNTIGSAAGNNANAPNAMKIGQQIAPWATLIKNLSPAKEKKSPLSKENHANQATIRAKPSSPPATVSAGSSAWRPGHKRTMTPAPEPEPEPVLQPLKPARTKAVFAKGRLVQIPPLVVQKKEKEASQKEDMDKDRAPSSLTFGEKSAASVSGGGASESGSLTPVFKRIQEYEMFAQKSSLGPNDVLGLGVGGSRASSRAPSSRSGSKGSRSSYGSVLPRSTLQGGINASFNLNFANDNDNDNQSDADEDWKSLTQFKNRDLNNSIARETRKALGMSGTMGGSDVSRYGANEPLDVSDPDSDVPDELRVILKESEETQARRLSALQDSPGYSASCSEESYDHDHVQAEFGGRSQLASDSGLPPSLAFELDLQLPSAPPASLPPPPPVFRAALVDEQDNHLGLDLDDFSLNSPTSEEDTKKSFDFTGELKKLNESGGSDRRSFVEQLENAFRTPAKVDLRYDLSFGALGLGKVGANGAEKSVVLEVPPVPELPVDLRRKMELSRDSETSASSDESRAEESPERSKSSSEFGGLSSGSRSQLVDLKLPNMTTMEKTRSEEVQGDDSKENSDSNSHFDMFSTSRIVDVKEPTVLQASDSSQDSNIPQGRILKPSLASSTSSRSSEGELNTSFRFGGLPRSESSASMPMPREKKDEKELTLSDIIPPPSHVRSLSGMDSYMLDGLEDDSVLKSIYTQMIGGLPGQRPRVNSDSSTQQSAEDKRQSIYKAASRPVSGVSFQGFDSFEEVRRGFEFSGERQPFYPPAAAAAAAAASRRPHRRHESVFSIASVSSYGHVINPGSTDPFDYGLPSLRERPSSEDMSSISMSMSIDDTFAFMRDRPRRRVESDASSFYFRPLQARGHRRRESNMSVSSQAPPISLYNRSFAAGHRRNDSSASTSSVAMSYVKHGANGGISAWARHRKDQSFDSVASDFSAMHLGRPGLGDKMFDMQAPLTSISASPPESVSASQENFDSIMDAYAEQKSSVDDSLFDKTGHRNSASSESVFGDDYSHSYQNGLLPPNHFRPLSILSRGSVHSPGREDDTMISMLGGGHVRRRSIGSIIEASPCVRVEKRKHSAVQNVKVKEHYESPNKARIVEKPSIASSHMFGGERMIKAQHGLLERQSLEESVLIAEGEDLSGYVPVFSRPAPTTRSRSSTCTSSSGGDTPPLSASDGSSISGGSQSSIDLASINIALANATHPVSTLNNMNRSRARAPGTGHRRRYSKANVSRSSVYETIEEENPGSNQTSPAHSVLSKKSSPTTRQAIFIVDSDTASIQSGHEESTVWDDERGIVALRRYYALRDEAHETVTESRRQWRDTPFSLFAVQTFQAPGSPSGMQAMLEHSVQNYGPLPSELRPRRVRTSSRPSPYPQRSAKSTMSPEKTRSSFADLNKSSFAELNKASFADLNKASFANLDKTPVLQPINPNKNIVAAAPSLEALKLFSPLVVDIEPKQEKAFGAPREARPRVGSNARRTALGWSKRSTGKSSTDQKENAGGSGMVMTPGENLRLNRPRPRGRPTPGGRTPATQARPIRI